MSDRKSNHDQQQEYSGRAAIVIKSKGRSQLVFDEVIADLDKNANKTPACR